MYVGPVGNQNSLPTVPHTPASTMSKPTVGWIGLGAMGSGMAKVCVLGSE